MLHYSQPQNPMDSMKRQKVKALEDDCLGQKASNILLGKGRGKLLTALKGMKWLGQSRNSAQL